MYEDIIGSYRILAKYAERERNVYMHTYIGIYYTYDKIPHREQSVLFITRVINVPHLSLSLSRTHNNIIAPISPISGARARPARAF